MTLAQQIVQTNHATYDMASKLADPSATPSIVLIGVDNVQALQRVIEKLNLNKISFSEFHEPDYDLGLTAIATVPLDESQREVMRNYRLWNESTFNTRVAQLAERRDSRKAYPEVGGSTPPPRAKRESSNDEEGKILAPAPEALVAQWSEQEPLNLCVAGSNPA